MDSDATVLVQQTLLGDAVNCSPYGVVVSEEDWGTVLAVSDAFCELVGYSRAELLELRAGALSARSRDEVEAVYDELSRLGRVASTARLTRKDGAVVEIGYRAARTRVGGIEFLLTITDSIESARLLESA